MTKYLLADREENLAYDSYFYAVFWDTETRTIRRAEYGSTAFPSPHYAPAEYLREIPEDVQKDIDSYFYQVVREEVQRADRSERDEPNDAQRGARLALTTAGKFKDNKTGETIEYSANDAGIVFWVGTFRQIYRNGYNKRDRSTLRVGLSLDDGRKIFVPLSKCRLDRDYLTDEELDARAERIANYRQYHAGFVNPAYVSM